MRGGFVFCAHDSVEPLLKHLRIHVEEAGVGAHEPADEGLSRSVVNLTGLNRLQHLLVDSDGVRNFTERVTGLFAALPELCAQPFEGFGFRGFGHGFTHAPASALR